MMKVFSKLKSQGWLGLDLLSSQRLPNFANLSRNINVETVIKDAACGYHFTVYLTEDSQIIHNTNFHLTDTKKTHNTKEKRLCLKTYGSSETIRVACGRAHTLIASEKGLWTYGNNGFGQCGEKSNGKSDLSLGVHRVVAFDDFQISDIVCGQDSSFVLSNGQVFSCGWSADGQTGSGSYKNQTSLSLVKGELSGEKVKKIAGASDTMLALTDKSEVFGWGNSEYRQLSMVTKDTQVNAPLQLPLNISGRVVDIGASGSSCYVLTDLGEIWSWGYGTLGRGPKDTSSSVPKIIPPIFFQSADECGASHIEQIYCGPSMAGAVTSNGTLFAWGVHLSHALGHKKKRPIYFPFKVDVERPVRKVAFGFKHLLIL